MASNKCVKFFNPIKSKLTKIITSIILVLSTGLSSVAFAEIHFPYSLKSTKGSISNTPLSVLQEQDGSNFIEFFVDTNQYVGIFSFRLKNIDTNNLKEFYLSIKFRDLYANDTPWKLHVRDFVANKWIKIDQNIQSNDPNWVTVNKLIDSNLENFINKRNNRAKLKLSTEGSVNSLQVDYLALESLVNSTDSGNGGTADSGESTDSAGNPTAEWWKPAPGKSWHIQYTGNLDTSLNAQIYNIDLFDTSSTVIDELHGKGKHVICYFSAGSFENWRPDADKFPENVKGKDLSGWPGEKWLDVSNLNVLLPIMEARLDMAVQKGCDAVDPDNVDGYTQNSGFNLTFEDQLNYLRALAVEAHDRGLAVGLKNNVEQIDHLIDSFDFSVNEECFSWNECDILLAFIDAGKPVFHIEYDFNTSQFCPQTNAMGFDSVKKRLELDAWYISCRSEQ